MTDGRTDFQHPWPGLDSYREAERAFFFGRDAEIAELRRRVKANRLTVLFGQSGLGKTSLLRAGLCPELRRDQLLPLYLRIQYEAGAPTPTEQVWLALAELFDLGERPRAGTSLWEWCHDLESGLLSERMRGITPVFIFDQFEEAFTLGARDQAVTAGREAFLNELACLVENRAPPTLDAALEEGIVDESRFDFDAAPYRIVLSLREDYLSALERERARMPSLMRNRVPLDRLKGPQALEAVVRPAPKLVTPKVAEKIVRFVAADEVRPLDEIEVDPSLLSLICRELNQKRVDRGEETITDFPTGTRDEILENFYDDCFQGLPPAVRAFLEDNLLTDSGHRDSIAFETAASGLERRGVPDAARILRTLVDRRLLRGEQHGPVQRLELAHDVIAGLVTRRRAERQARDASAKARDAERARFRRVLVRSGLFAVVAAIALIVTFAIDAQKQRRLAEDARRLADAQRMRADEARLVAEDASAEALTQKDLALRAREDAVAARGEAEKATALTKQALSRYGVLDAQRYLDQGDVHRAQLALAESGEIGGAGGDRRWIDLLVPPPALNLIERIDVGRPLEDVAVSSDGLWVAVRGEQGEVLLLDRREQRVAELKELREIASDGAVRLEPRGSGTTTAPEGVRATAFAFHPAGATLALAIREGPLVLIDLAQMRRTGELAVPAEAPPASNTDPWPSAPRLTPKLTEAGAAGSAVSALAFSWDGQLLAAAFADGWVLRWKSAKDSFESLDAYAVPKERRADLPPLGIALTPANVWIATGTDILRLYTKKLPSWYSMVAGSGGGKPAKTPRRPLRPKLREEGVLTASLKDANAASHVTTMSQIDVPVESPVTAVAVFYEAGQEFVGLGSGRILTGGGKGQAFAVHDREVSGLALSADARLLFSVSADSSLAIWSIETRWPMLSAFSNNGVKAVTSVPETGAVLLSAGSYGVELDPGEAGLRWWFPAVRGDSSQFFSPSGKLLAGEGARSEVLVRDVKAGRTVATFEADSQSVPSIVFSPDERLIAFPRLRGTVEVRSCADPEAWKIDAGRKIVRALAFSPDSRTLATGDQQGGFTEWKLEPGGKTVRAPWTGTAPSEVQLLRYVQDGRTLLVADRTGGVGFWDVEAARWKAVHRATAELGRLITIAVSADGRRLFGGHSDGAISLWDLAELRRDLFVRTRTSAVQGLALHPRGDYLVVVHQDGTLRVTRAPAAPLTVAEAQKASGMRIENFRISALPPTKTGLPLTPVPAHDAVAAEAWTALRRAERTFADTTGATLSDLRRSLAPLAEFVRKHPEFAARWRPILTAFLPILEAPPTQPLDATAGAIALAAAGDATFWWIQRIICDDVVGLVPPESATWLANWLTGVSLEAAIGDARAGDPGRILRLKRHLDIFFRAEGAGVERLKERLRGILAEKEVQELWEAAKNYRWLSDEAVRILNDSPEKAEPLLRQAVARDPRAYDAHYYLGRCLRFQKKLDAAVESYQRALLASDLDSGLLANIYIELAWAHRDRKDEKAEAENFDRAAASDPTSPYARRYRAEHYLAKKDYRAAIADWDALISDTTDQAKLSEYLLGRAEAAAASGDTRGARDDIAAAVLKSTGASNATWQGIAKKKTDEGRTEFDYLHGLAAYARLLKNDPDNATVLMDRARLYRAFGRWDQAVADLTRAAELGLKGANVEGFLGETLLRQGRAREGKDRLERAIVTAPDLPGNYTARRHVHARLGDAEGAQKDLDLERALKLDDGARRALMMEAAALAEWRGDLDGAVRELTALLRDLGSPGTDSADVSEALAMRAEVLERQGKLDLAKADCEQLRKQKHYYYVERAKVCGILGLWDEASTALGALKPRWSSVDAIYFARFHARRGAAASDESAVLRAWYYMGLAHDRGLLDFYGWTEREPAFAGLRTDPLWNDLQTALRATTNGPLRAYGMAVFWSRLAQRDAAKSINLDVIPAFERPSKPGPWTVGTAARAAGAAALYQAFVRGHGSWAAATEDPRLAGLRPLESDLLTAAENRYEQLADHLAAQGSRWPETANLATATTLAPSPEDRRRAVEIARRLFRSGRNWEAQVVLRPAATAFVADLGGDARFVPWVVRRLADPVEADDTILPIAVMDTLLSWQVREEADPDEEEAEELSPRFALAQVHAAVGDTMTYRPLAREVVAKYGATGDRLAQDAPKLAGFLALTLRDFDARRGARALDASDPPSARLMFALALQRAGDVDAALACLDAGMKGEKVPSALVRTKVRILSEAGRKDAALAALDAAKPPTPKHEALYKFERARVLAAAGERDQAAPLFAEVAAHPQGLGSAVAIARAHGTEFDPALNELHALAAAQPFSADAALDLATGYSIWSRHDQELGADPTEHLRAGQLALAAALALGYDRPARLRADPDLARLTHQKDPVAVHLEIALVEEGLPRWKALVHAYAVLAQSFRSTDDQTRRLRQAAIDGAISCLRLATLEPGGLDEVRRWVGPELAKLRDDPFAGRFFRAPAAAAPDGSVRQLLSDYLPKDPLDFDDGATQPQGFDQWSGGKSWLAVIESLADEGSTAVDLALASSTAPDFLTHFPLLVTTRIDGTPTSIRFRASRDFTRLEVVGLGQRSQGRYLFGDAAVRFLTGLVNARRGPETRR